MLILVTITICIDIAIPSALYNLGKDKPCIYGKSSISMMALIIYDGSYMIGQVSRLILYSALISSKTSQLQVSTKDNKSEAN